MENRVPLLPLLLLLLASVEEAFPKYSFISISNARARRRRNYKGLLRNKVCPFFLHLLAFPTHFGNRSPFLFFKSLLLVCRAHPSFIKEVPLPIVLFKWFSTFCILAAN